RHGPHSRDLSFRMADPQAARAALDALRIGIDLSSGEGCGGWDGCDLVLSVDEASGRAALAFRRDAFTATTIRTVARHVAFFLEEFFAGAATPLAALPLLPPEERAAIKRSNSTATPVSDALGIADEISRQMQRTPQRDAIRWGAQALDYAALDARRGLIANRLLSHGVRRGTIVGLHLERTPDLAAAVLAPLAVGAAYLPLDPAYPAECLRYMAEDSAAQVILTSRPIAGRLGSCHTTLLVLDDLVTPAAPAADGNGL